MSLLVVEGLGLARRSHQVLKGVGLVVEPGVTCALMGRSGAGKSTVLRAAAALEPFQAGRIAVDGFSLVPGPLPPESSLAPLRRQLGMVFQGYALFEHLTVLENIMLAPVHVLRRSRAEAEAQAHALLESLGVGSRAAAHPREISGGEAQRVAIARALATGPRVLLMDEPTAALDPARRASLGELLRRLAREGRGLLVATHDAQFARAYADRVAVLAEGSVVEEGPAAAVLDAPRHEETRRLLAAESVDPE